MQKQRLAGRGTLIPLDHPPDGRVECDFGQVAVDYPHGRQITAVLIVVWSFSNCPFMVALPSQRTEAVLHGMTLARQHFECVPKEVWWDNREVFKTPEAIQCYAGTAPVTRQSGRSRGVSIRRACTKTLRATVHLWADLSRKCCAWADAYYQKKKQQGMNHAAAIQCLGQRWLKILWKMWQTRTHYNESLHLQNQIRHGSWVIKLLPETAVAS